MGFLSNIVNPAGAIKKWNQQGIAAINSNTEKGVGYLNPYMQSGEKANTAVENIYGLNGAEAQNQSAGLYQTSPGYEWQMKQGIGAIDNSAAAKGLRKSGATLKSLQTYGQGMADQDYQRWLEGITGLGKQGAASAFGAGNIQIGSNKSIGEIYSGIGTAQANQGIMQGNMIGKLFDKAISAASAAAGAA
jgi:hypothetical protein